MRVNRHLLLRDLTAAMYSLLWESGYVLPGAPGEDEIYDALRAKLSTISDSRIVIDEAKR